MGCVIQFFFIVLFFSISEVSLLLWVTEHTNILFTIGCCVFTGIVGGYFVRQQGLVTLNKIQATISEGKLPADEAVEALMLLIVGILLCLPGFITDTMGFLIIIPFIRKPIANILVKYLSTLISRGTVANVNIYSNVSSQSTQDSGQYNNIKFTDESDDKIEEAEIISEVNTKSTIQGERQNVEEE